MARHDSRIVVIDSTKHGMAEPLPHSLYSIVYVPSWLRVRWEFKWTTTAYTLHTLNVMKEYFNTPSWEERPIRAQRCLYSIKALHVFGYRLDGVPRFSELAREQLITLSAKLRDYLEKNPVVAWDWIVSWSECFAMAEAFPNEYVRMYRRLRSHYTTKRSHQAELRYFLDIMETVARERKLDMEHKT